MRVENEGRTYAETARETSPRSGGHKKHRRSQWWILLLAVVTATVIVVAGILPRIQARTALRRETAEMAVPAVVVVQPKRSAPAKEIVLPANVQAFADARVSARTNGYLQRWYVDIGSRVTEHQLVLEIGTPEVTRAL